MDSDLAWLVCLSANITMLPCLDQIVAIVFCLKLGLGFLFRPWNEFRVAVLLNGLGILG